MAYPYFTPYYPQPMQDNLMQMRQQYQPPQMQPLSQPPQNPIAQGGVQWVSGEQEARSWMIAPNAAVALWDSTAPTVYLRQADAQNLRPRGTRRKRARSCECKAGRICHAQGIRRTGGNCWRNQGKEKENGRGE